MVLEEVDTVLVPLEGDDDGVGSFLGSICSQEALGCLEACDRTIRANRLNSKNLCFKEHNMIMMMMKKNKNNMPKEKVEYCDL